MSIKYAILGLLSEGPTHGYAVHALFEERLGDFWELNYGQVYQVLTALQKQGLVAVTDERVGRRPWRKVHAITPKGRDDLSVWIGGVAPSARPFRDEFYLRLLFAGRLAPNRVRRLIDERLERTWSDLSGLVLQRDAAPVSFERHCAIVRRLYVEAAILHLEASVNALQLCKATFARSASGAPVGELLAGVVAEQAVSEKLPAAGQRR